MTRRSAGHYTEMINGAEYTVCRIAAGEWICFRTDNPNHTVDCVLYSKREAVDYLFAAVQDGLITPPSCY